MKYPPSMVCALLATVIITNPVSAEEVNSDAWQLPTITIEVQNKIDEKTTEQLQALLKQQKLQRDIVDEWNRPIMEGFSLQQPLCACMATQTQSAFK
ncbi:MAG: hypothetical protein V7711_05335 [Pseudomonadales bacterium]